MHFLQFQPEVRARVEDTICIIDNPSNRMLKSLMTSEDKPPTHTSSKNIQHTFEDWMKLGDREQWQKFPKLDPVTDFTDPEGPGLKLMTWLLYFFAPELLSLGHKWDNYLDKCSSRNILADYGNLLELLTLDDMTYIFIQLQNNINKWQLIHRAWKKGLGPQAWENKKQFKQLDVGKKHLSDEDAKFMDTLDLFGAEYPGGSGVSGSAGMPRYAVMKRFFWMNYYKREDGGGGFAAQTMKNRDALKKQLVALREERIENLLDSDKTKSDDQNSSGTKNASLLANSVLDLDDIDQQMCMYMEVPITAV